MKHRSEKHSVDMLFILLLFAGFLMTAVLLVTMGTGEYRRIVSTMQENNDLRTPSAYLMQSVRQNKEAGSVYIEEIDGTDTLAVRREIAGRPYVLRIYAWKGSLREMLTPEGNYDLTLEAGTLILPIRDMELEERGNAVIARITEENGRTDSCVLSATP